MTGQQFGSTIDWTIREGRLELNFSAYNNSQGCRAEGLDQSIMIRFILPQTPFYLSNSQITLQLLSIEAIIGSQDSSVGLVQAA